MWAAQLAGTIAIAFAIYIFFGESAPLFRGIDPEWTRFGLLGILAAGTPALAYLRRFSAALNEDIRATRAHGGVPDPRARQELLRKLQVGGVLCELPLALGAIYLMAGGEKRWFVTAACVSIVLRLSYRPFRASPR
ncbi:MAG: hypothetical protein H7Y14_04845 [Burkholderiales bacterium]|nr:hypothetical protein [Burkholderiales bacterium]